MVKRRVDQFRQEREALNDVVLKYGGRNLKRFWSLDGAVYRDGALPARMKELLGLVSSLVLRCDDCITYHAIRCKEEGVTTEELEETVTIALVVGGSITIPHVRRLMQVWEELQNPEDADIE